ncbi:multicopper oxidase family protein [Actinomadura alba]|uniref:Multicopper oxidase domain-containing protein n=1 Tax=Actinomadura alba TaxID=406431 RepID=A0ABR7LYT3_9ACTN|nr:multicopper oxidase [Actinomadura alba]MBC6469709.1 multicopper oxidase domain-containing protein [Actinomadura alba]
MAEVRRRDFLRIGAIAGTSVVFPVPIAGTAPARPVAGGSLDPARVRKYVTPLMIPAAMPPARISAGIDHYEIAVRQFRQQVLPRGLPSTTVWGYGAVGAPASFAYPAFTIEARHGRTVEVDWINGLVDRDGRFLPHLLSIDQTLHWADPPGGTAGRDSYGRGRGTYRGPVPIVTHVHGNHTFDHSDGYPEAWYLPDARDIPAGFAREGSWYDRFRAGSPLGDRWGPGRAVFEYPNDQPAGTQWYHDHTLGLTRANVYAGPVGFYLLRGGPNDVPPGVLPGPAPRTGDPPGRRYYEIPLAVQDRSFNADGSLFYPASRAFFDGFRGPYAPNSDVPPIWNPEFLGNMIVVNGTTWPVLAVEPRRYRFRLLNGSNTRVFIFKLVSDPMARRPVTAALPIWMIGTESGFMAAPARLDRLLLSPAERADVIVDFTGLPVGAEVYLINEGPDAVFNGKQDAFADPATTGQVMKFQVGRLTSDDTSTPPSRLSLPAPDGPGAETHRRQVSFAERSSTRVPGIGPVAVLLGTMREGAANPLRWHDPVTENPRVGAVEVWEMYNTTPDAHPIHLHEVRFEVVDRQRIGGGGRRPPDPWEQGLKDTVIAYPQEITRVKARFDRAGRFVWHCHMLEHEDNEMMRPYDIGSSGAPVRSHHHPG